MSTLYLCTAQGSMRDSELRLFHTPNFKRGNQNFYRLAVPPRVR